MQILIILFLIISIYYLKFVLHLSIDWKTLYRKGFQKIDNAFGLFCYCRQAGER